MIFVTIQAIKQRLSQFDFFSVFYYILTIESQCVQDTKASPPSPFSVFSFATFFFFIYIFEFLSFVKF